MTARTNSPPCVAGGARNSAGAIGSPIGSQPVTAADGSTAGFPHFVLDRGKPGLIAVDRLTAELDIRREVAGIAVRGRVQREGEVVHLVAQRLTDLVPASTMHTLRGKVQVMGRTDQGIRLFDVDVFEDGRGFDIAIHRDGSVFLIEFEPKKPDRVRDPGASCQWPKLRNPKYFMGSVYGD